MADRDIHYKGYDKNRVVNKSTNATTDKTIRNIITHHLHYKHLMIHHPSKQTEVKWGNGCLPEGKWGSKYTIQYHRCSNTASQISPDIHLYLHYVDLPQGLPLIFETSCHTHNGLCQCSYDQYTVTKYTPCIRTQNYAQTHWIATTFNNASTKIIEWHTPSISISWHMCW